MCTCKKYKACTHALTPRYVTIVRGQFAGMRARPLGRSISAWGGVALSTVPNELDIAPREHPLDGRLRLK